MALYLGKSGKLKIHLNKEIYSIKWPSGLSTITEVMLSSSDDYVLKDCNELYLIPKEDE